MSRENDEHIGTADLLAGAQAHQQAHQQAHHEDVERAHRDDAAMRAQPMPDGGQAMPQQAPMQQHGDTPGEQLAPLFPPQLAGDFRQRWDAVQIGFVDDPRQAVQQADELVAEVMKNLAASFAEQRSRLESGLGANGQAGTEELRMALWGYRSFFMRLLSV